MRQPAARFDFVIVGAGLLGAATARHLAGTGAGVALVGPAEPDSRDRGVVFGAHYDQARLFHRLGRSPAWTTLAKRSLPFLQSAASSVGVPTLRATGMVLAVPLADRRFLAERVAQASQRSGTSVTLIAGEAASERWPFLHLPPQSAVAWDPPAAGHFNPRQLVDALIASAVAQGAVLVRDVVVRLDDVGRSWWVTTRDGRSLAARAVVIAAGAYSNWPGLLPRPLALRFKSESVVLAEVSAATAAAWAERPTVIFEPRDWPVTDIYVVPPVQYPDGRFYLKLGANTRHDRYLATVADINEWYRRGDSGRARPDLQTALARLFPTLTVLSWRTERCVITRTAHGLPYVDVLEPGRLFAAVGGNGAAAKAADAIGKLAAEVASTGRWRDSLPAADFRARFADEALIWPPHYVLPEEV